MFLAVLQGDLSLVSKGSDWNNPILFYLPKAFCQCHLSQETPESFH